MIVVRLCLCVQTEKQEWLAQLRGVALSSDAFFPFRDSIDRAVRVRALNQFSNLN